MLIPFIQYPHGTIKWFLESSQGLLLRLPSLQILLLIGLFLLGASRFTKQMRWQISLWAAMCLLMYITPHYGVLEFTGTCFLILFRFIPFESPSTVWQRRLSNKWIKWSPVCWLLSPQILESLHTFRPLARFLKVGQILFPLGLLFGWQWLDVLSHYDQVRKDMEQWPTERLDSTIKELAHSEPGVRADWHGVRILGDTAIITCERKPRLSAINLQTGFSVDMPLHPRWGIENVGPLESEVSTDTNLTWTVNGGNRLMENKWDGSKWTRYREVKLPSELGFSYITRSRTNLYITEVQTGDSKGTRKILVAPLPSLKPIREVELKLNGKPAPMPREALWIPSIKRHIYASEFGQYLYAANLGTGKVTPWLKAQTFNGKMVWNNDTERIYLAVPNRMQVHVIDPTIPAIEYTLWTQPGVRALAVDATRNVLLSASVLTGQIWVQNLQSGRLIERMGTVYPMVREMEVSEELGLGVLTTWNAVYRFDYTQQLGD